MLSHLEQGLAHQIKSLRISRGLTQLQLAQALSLKSQSAIARLEDPSYGKMSIPTLMKVASFFDVAFLGRFVPYSKFFREIEDVRPKALEAKSFSEEDVQGVLERFMSVRTGAVARIDIHINVNFHSRNVNRIIDITPSAVGAKENEGDALVDRAFHFRINTSPYGLIEK